MSKEVEPTKGNETEEKGAGVVEQAKAEIMKLLGESTEDFIKATKKELKQFIDEQKTAKEAEIGIYSTKKAAKRAKLNDKFKKMVKAVYSNDLSVLKEMSTDSESSPYAGFTVDRELSAEIRHLITDFGVARQEMGVITLNKHELDANSLATDVSAFWTDEGDTIPATEAVLAQSKLELKKLAAIVTLTSELIEDSEVDLWTFLVGRLAEKIAEKEDAAFFDGDGTSAHGGFTGILRNGLVNVVRTSGEGFDSLVPQDFLNLQDATPTNRQNNYKYYFHRSVMNFVRGLREDAVQAGDKAGAFLYQAPGAGQPELLWNKNIVLVEVMPSMSESAADRGFVIYGDLRRACILGNKGTMTVRRFDAGVVPNVAANGTINLIATDREAIRVTQRVGYVTVLPNALCVLKTQASS